MESIKIPTGFLYFYINKLKTTMETETYFYEIRDFLESQDWEVSEDKNTYKKQCVVNERRIIINGVEARPRQIPLDLKIEFMGFGSINGKQILGYEFVIGSTNETIYIYDTQEFIDVYENMFGRFNEK